MTAERLHPATLRALRKMIQLHGAARIAAAVEHLKNDDDPNATPAPAPSTRLTMIEFSGADHTRAASIAARLGYTQTAYTSTSALIGLFCLPENPKYHPAAPHVVGWVVKTRELGFMFVQCDSNDPHIADERIGR